MNNDKAPEERDPFAKKNDEKMGFKDILFVLLIVVAFLLYVFELDELSIVIFAILILNFFVTRVTVKKKEDPEDK